jgi:hypothetical protein
MFYILLRQKASAVSGHAIAITSSPGYAALPPVTR